MEGMRVYEKDGITEHMIEMENKLLSNVGVPKFCSNTMLI